MATVVIIHILL